MTSILSILKKKDIFLAYRAKSLGITFVTLLCCSFTAVAQAPVIKEWDKTYGSMHREDEQSGEETLRKMVPTPDGGYLLGGTSNSLQDADKSQDRRGGADYWVVKIAKDGTKVWDKTFGGSDYDSLTTVINTPDGGYLLGGFSVSGISGDKSQVHRGYQDYWIVKLDANGNQSWDKTFGSLGHDRLRAIVTTPEGGYLIGGESDGDYGDRTIELTNYQDYWLIKIDGNGKKIWERAANAPDARNSLLTAMYATPDGGYLLGGTSEGEGSNYLNFQDRSRDFAVVKLDADGNQSWAKIYNDNYRVTNDGYYRINTVLKALIPTANGHYLLGGTSFEYTIDFEYPDDSEFPVPYVSGKTPEDYFVIDIDANGTKQWKKTVGGTDRDYLAALAPTPDGGYLLGGSSFSGASGDRSQPNITGYTYEDDMGVERTRPLSDYWVIKLSQNGDKVWDKAYGGDNYSIGPDTYGGNFLHDLLVTADGGYLLGGTKNWDRLGDLGSNDFWVVKIKDTTTPASAQNWRFGGSSTDRLAVVIKTQDGGYLSGGYSNSPISGDKSQGGKGGYDFWLVKTDAAGTKQWDKTYGGSGDDYLNRIIETADGGYLLAGSSKSNSSGDKSQSSRGDQDYWLVKISADGAKQWDKTYGGSGFDDLRKVSQLTNGDYLLAGTSNSPVSGEKTQAGRGGADYWVLRVSSTGTKIWDKRYGGSGQDYLESFTKTSDGGFVLAGSSTSGKNSDKTQASKGLQDYWLVKITSSGAKVWDKTYGGTGQDELYSVGRTTTGEFFVAGHSTSGTSGDKTQANQGGKDYWMLKLSSTGTKLWDKSFGGNGEETLRSIIQTPDGGYILAGSSASNVSGDKTQASQGGTDYWIVRTDASGNKLDDQRFGGSGADELRYIERTADGGYLLGGRSDSGVSGNRTQPSQGGTDYWLVKVAPMTAATSSLAQAAEASPASSAVVVSNGLQAYPNPFSDRVTTAFSFAKAQAVSVKVYNSQGQEVATLYQGLAQAGKPYQFVWQPTAQQQPGLYIIKLQAGGQVQHQRVMLNR